MHNEMPPKAWSLKGLVKVTGKKIMAGTVASGTNSTNFGLIEVGSDTAVQMGQECRGRVYSVHAAVNYVQWVSPKALSTKSHTRLYPLPQLQDIKIDDARRALRPYNVNSLLSYLLARWASDIRLAEYL